MSSPVDPSLRTDEFDYDLPQELIAQHPLQVRDSSRMLVVDRSTGEISHATFRELPGYLDRGDLVVANNTRVMNARLTARRAISGGKIELLILEETANYHWTALARPAKRSKTGDRLVIGTDSTSHEEPVEVRVVQKHSDGVVELETDPGFDLSALTVGEVPLPPYITAPLHDSDRYQTVYASQAGSAAAPTAGLHVSAETISAVRSRGMKWAEITLHIGLDTFRPVAAPFVRDHAIHHERCSVSDDVASQIQSALHDQKRVLAIGTTAARTLETAGLRWQTSDVRGFETETSLFITPGYEWRIVSSMLTNFHLPRSTLLMMVSSFGGKELIARAYQEAIAAKYRFYSFGDAMLIL